MLSKSQLKKIEKIIRRRFRTFSMKTIGERSLTSEEIADLKASGLLPSHVREYIGDAHALGKISATLGPSTARGLTYNQILEMVKKMSANAEVEKRAIEYATRHAGQYIQGLEDDMVKDVTLAGLRTSKDLLRQEVAGAIKNRLTPGQLKTNLWDAIDHRGRDWQRIASTELQNAIQQGIHNEIQLAHGDDQLVYKQPAPNACKHCKRVYLHGDGTPKIFKLSDLETSNVGRRADEWKPTIEAVHPWCQCQLHVLPEGFGFVKKPVAAEKFEFGGKTYGKGARVPEEVYDRMPKELKEKTKVSALLEFTGEETEPVSKAEINLPVSEEDHDCVYCEY